MLWIGIATGLSLIWWKLFTFGLFVALAVITFLAAGAFAFLHPYNQTFLGFLMSLFLYISKPKQYLWRKIGSVFSRKTPKKKTEELVPIIKKGFPEEKVEKLADVLDDSAK